MFRIGKDCQIDPTAVINVREGYLGDGSVVREGVRIEGERVEIGREAFLDRFATVGGGSCFDPGAFLKAGDWFHMGVQSQVNTARGVTVGHEFGCGIETKIFTHGAYIDSFNLGAPVQWAPVTIGNNVWLPNAWVNPGVTIGDNVIVAARSLVNRDIPSGALAAGVPAKLVKENWLPRALTLEDKRKLIHEIVEAARARCEGKLKTNPIVSLDNSILFSRGEDETWFDLEKKTITGPANEWTQTLKDQLRRNGIRFRYKSQAGVFTAWKESLIER